MVVRGTSQRERERNDREGEVWQVWDRDEARVRISLDTCKQRAPRRRLLAGEETDEHVRRRAHEPDDWNAAAEIDAKAGAGTTPAMSEGGDEYEPQYSRARPATEKRMNAM